MITRSPETQARFDEFLGEEAAFATYDDADFARMLERRLGDRPRHSHWPVEWDDELFALLVAVRAECPTIRFQQVKEKFGSLRVYFDCDSDDERARAKMMIDRAVARLGEMPANAEAADPSR